MEYPRAINGKIEASLESPEILLLLGARRVGKTTILRQIRAKLERKKKATFFLNLEDPDFLKLLNESPKNLFKIININLRKTNFVFIDEVQYLENPSNFLKYFYDEYQGKIKLIVSGSSAFYIDQKFKDSLAGRKKIFYIRPLSFKEFLLFKREDKLAKSNLKKLSLIEQDEISKYYHEFMIYGSYPRVVLAKSKEEKEDILRELAYSYVKKDMYESGVRDDIAFLSLFKILASQIGNLVNSSELANCLNISKTSVDNYLYILQKSFHINLINPFHSNKRKELSKMPKIYFQDLGLRNFLLGDFDTFIKRKDKGEILENAVFRELLDKLYLDDINFWRDNNENEVDFIIKKKRAIEVKTSISSFRASKYKSFRQTYPEIKFNLATIDFKDRLKENLPKRQLEDINDIKNVWEI